MTSESKLVKVDNWGVYFLQRLKHFFNRTDFCDLTLQFQDNAQLKVHRLVLSSCTEYFELLERTCEMYDDCMIMPDDLQADVVVPIVNFMYTGQLEFTMEILDRLHATSEIMNMPVLSKLLDSHRPRSKTYGKRQPKLLNVSIKLPIMDDELTVLFNAPPKRSYAKAFEKIVQNKKNFQASNKSTSSVPNGSLVYHPPSPIPLEALKVKPPKVVSSDPRPTRYELPEELDTDNLFENSFCNISYTSQPLMVHPETTKQYAKRPRQDKGEASTSKITRSSTLDIVECKKITREQDELFFEESMVSDETQMFKPAFLNVNNVKTESARDPNKLFDQLLDDQKEEQSAKVTIETTKNNKAGANLDHAKIISEVLKKYPHLVKSNKNIKLKIFNNSSSNKGVVKKQKASPQLTIDKAENNKSEGIVSDFTYETDVLDSKQAARLIALGAENIEGPWICLICGTPGRALHFTSYFKFRRHLVDVHNEKPVLNICEYCGQRMSKRNHLLHHMYTKHGVEPPSTYSFPKCSQCNYIALTEALLVKHKLTHVENKNFRCNVCPSSFNSSNQLLAHIQSTGHKYIADRKHNHQCIYCLRVFIRENNLYAHLKTHHKLYAIKDGIIDESDDETKDDEVSVKDVKNELVQNVYDINQMEYHIQQKSDGNIQLIQKKPSESTTPPKSKQKILNPGVNPKTYPITPNPRSKSSKTVHNMQAKHDQDVITSLIENNQEIVVIDNNEYIMSGNRLIPRKPMTQPADEYILSDMMDVKSKTSSQSMGPATSMNYAAILNSNENIQGNIILKDTGDLSDSIPIYVSNEEEYKALMSTSHNIIFDSSDENKTLAVLTTPDAPTLDNASINLENTQNNDMMIIHEEYPLNVSEAVATNSSNIVVVYSQQVGDPNKQYQLLTTQAFGQYVQSSSILSQNYETVSTSTPVMSAHILDSQVATWQRNIHQNIDDEQAETSATLQAIVQADEILAKHAPEAIEDTSTLPEVHLMPNPEPTHINQNENNNSEAVQPELVSTQSMSMEIDAPLVDAIEEKIENTTTSAEAIPENKVNMQEDMDETEILKQSGNLEQVSISENIPEVEQKPEVLSLESSNSHENIINMHSQSSNSNENIISLNIQSSNIDENIISMDVQNSETSEKVMKSSDTNETQINVDDPITDVASTKLVCTENELCATVAVKQIQDLASEWSVEPAETPSPACVEKQAIIEEQNEIKAEVVQESVENIQHEMKKQMHETNTQVEDNNEESTKDDPPALEENKSETSKTDITPHVKLSSLLNDWDDNDDFHEDKEMGESVSEPIIEDGVPSIIQNPDKVPEGEKELLTDNISSGNAENETDTVPDDGKVIKNTPDPDPDTNQPLEKKTATNQDNIKKLVSDWDDDEEDNKE